MGVETTLLAAAVLGASKAIADVSDDALRTAYKVFKDLLVQESEPAGKALLSLEQNVSSEARREVLLEELEKPPLASNDALLKAAKKLLEFESVPEEGSKPVFDLKRAKAKTVKVPESEFEAEQVMDGTDGDFGTLDFSKMKQKSPPTGGKKK